ncbi:MAG: hypothetical protein A4E59_01383 [Syntrophorhabdus sp. PtaB.Bin027]|nr:MAG: hypothetical protein A4E59_01383 [Syntrophorhabdus sp. PtaB.Bin027]OQB73715.1 MAG: hypothetical protein BWX92_03271 [Deltaproteobacteria bacterium ADurb.Bin135]
MRLGAEIFLKLVDYRNASRRMRNLLFLQEQEEVPPLCVTKNNSYRKTIDNQLCVK